MMVEDRSHVKKREGVMIWLKYGDVFPCPLLFPTPTEETYDHAQFAKGCGCVKDVNWELGGQMRVTLDRDGALYHAISNQRTSCERINSQAQALGIERPKVRNGRSVAHLNTLTYLVINARALERVVDSCFFRYTMVYYPYLLMEKESTHDDVFSGIVRPTLA